MVTRHSAIQLLDGDGNFSVTGLGVALQRPMLLLPLPMLLLLTDSLLDRTELCGHCKSKSISDFELQKCKDCLKLLICFNGQYSTSDYSYQKYCKIMCKTW